MWFSGKRLFWRFAPLKDTYFTKNGLKGGGLPLPLLGLNVSTDPLSPPCSSVRGRTPVRQLSPTPLSRHRSRSREASVSQCGLVGGSLAEVCVGRSNTPDPTAYFSRSGSSLSLYGGRGSSQTDPFRLAMEAKQAQDDHQVSL